MKRRWTLTVLPLLAALAACSGGSSPAPAPAPAPTTAPAPAYDLKLTAGSAGLESAGTTAAHYWFTASTATFVLSNSATTTESFELSGALNPPPCGTGQAQVSVEVGELAPIEVVAASAEHPFLEQVSVPAQSSVRVDFVTHTGSCTISGDGRTFFSGVSGLAVAPSPDVAVGLDAGISGTEYATGYDPLTWMIARTAAITLTHRANTQSQVVYLAGTLVPPPCEDKDLTATLTVPGQTKQVIVVDHGSGGEPFNVPFTVPTGQSVQVSIALTTGGCKTTNDPRTFFGGFTSLAATVG